MEGNSELVLAHTQNIQPTVKDGENEELAKRIRAVEEIVKREREKRKLEQQKTFTLAQRANYHKTIAVLCEKYSGLDKDVVVKLSNADKEYLADSVEYKARKRSRLETYLRWFHFFVGAGTISALAYFLHPASLLAFLAVPCWMPVWSGDKQVDNFLNYRAQTTKEDRVALQDEAKTDGT